MKIRLTIGSITGLVLSAAGAIAEHEALIKLITQTTGGKVAAAGVAILALAKGILSFNHADIPADKKATLGPVVLEKTGPFAP